MMLYPDNCYAVSAQSRHKDGAWKFIESFFTQEWQEKITPNYAFSIDKDRFEQQLKMRKGCNGIPTGTAGGGKRRF